VGHFIAQRVTAIALMVLVPLFIASAVISCRAGWEGAVEWIAQPWNAVLLVLMSAAAFSHMRLGMQVVIEDYLGGGLRQAALIANTFVAAIGFTVCLLAVLKIWTAG
jgi:succinate dehydrogenase / fumarate reductase membrane anchor subunit